MYARCPRLDTNTQMLKAPKRALRSVIGQHISLARRADTGSASKLLGIHEACPILYEIPNPQLEIHDVYGLILELEENHRLCGDNFLVRMSMPPVVYETMERIGLAQKLGSGFNVTGHLERVDAGRKDIWMGGVITGRGDDLREFYPTEFMPSDIGQPQIIINLSAADRPSARSTLHLLCDLAYYSAKAGILSDARYANSPQAELLAKLFALSIQHRFLNALRIDNFVVLEEKAADESTDRSGVYQLQGPDIMFGIGEIFRGIHHKYADIFRLMGQNCAIREEALSAFRIDGTFEDLSINNPIHVEPNK